MFILMVKYILRGLFPVWTGEARVVAQEQFRLHSEHINVIKIFLQNEALFLKLCVV